MKTAGTTWLEELIGLALAREIYAQAHARFDGTLAVNQYVGGGLVCGCEHFADLDEDRLELYRHLLPALRSDGVPLDPFHPVAPTRMLNLFRRAPRPGYTAGNWISDPARCLGAALDFHIHDTDVVHFLLGPPRGVFSQGLRLPTGWDHIQTQYLYEDGPIGMENSDDELLRVKALADKHGLGLSGLATGLFRGANGASADATTREKAAAILDRQIHCAKVLGIDAILIVPATVDADFIPDCEVVPYADAWVAPEMIPPVPFYKHHPEVLIENTKRALDAILDT